MVELRGVEGGHNDRMAQGGCVRVEVPRPNARNVTAVQGFRLKVEARENVLDMIPVLLKECSCVVNNKDFYRREEVVVFFLRARIVSNQIKIEA